MEEVGYEIPHGQGGRLAWLYAHGEVVSRDDRDEGVGVVVRLLPADRKRFEREGSEG
jgi:GTP-binding protein HflX